MHLSHDNNSKESMSELSPVAPGNITPKAWTHLRECLSRDGWLLGTCAFAPPSNAEKRAFGGKTFYRCQSLLAHMSGSVDDNLANAGLIRLSTIEEAIIQISTTEESGMQVLRNCNVGGKPRYSLPAIPVGTSNGYRLYYRPEAEVIHHTKGKSWNLPAPELMLVPQNGQHVVSMSLTPEHVPLECYVNINLQPTPYSKGMEWQDLELDLKLTRADHGWYLALLDVDEYDQANLSASLRASTEAEIARIIDAIQEGRFPFRCVGSWHQILKDFPSRSL